MFDWAEKNLRLIKYLLTHKGFVTWAALFKVGGVPLKQVLVHDMSKFSCAEFQTYRRKFRPLEGEEKLPDELWDQALLHHYNSNPHHPEYWRIESRLIPIPDRYIKEMVADWLGASRALNGSWDLTNFLNSRFQSFSFHPDTSLKVRLELRALGYDCEAGEWSRT